MKNFIQEGCALTVAAPYDRLSGEGAKIGVMFGVAASTVLSGADGVFNTEGVFELAKTDSQAWTLGQKIYWDDTTKLCTNVAASNITIGVAVEAVAVTAGLILGKVRLNGSF
jgi:predicted RecA/RadA family phage recombinase